MPKFTFATASEGFDKHILQSVRGYDALWNDVLRYSQYFVENETNTNKIKIQVQVLYHIN